MSSDVSDPNELERERQDLLREFSSDRDPNAPIDFGPGSFGCHELLDRTALLVRILEEQIVEHPACFQRPDWFALAHEAASLLHRLYQEVGREHLTP